MSQFTFSFTSIIAQVNFGANSVSILGIVMYFGGAVLCCFAFFKPHLVRYHDIMFAQFGWICGSIFIFQGWRLDPILQLGEILLFLAAIFSVIDCIRQRSIRLKT